MRMFVFLAISLFGVMPLSSSAAPLREPQSHICPPADEPIMAMSVDEPAPPRSVKSPPPPVGLAAPAVEPMQMMGCLERDYAIRPIEVADALRATAIIEEPGSTAAIFAYADPAERDALMTRWTHGHDEKASIPAKPTRVHIAGWST